MVSMLWRFHGNRSSSKHQPEWRFTPLQLNLSISSSKSTYRVCPAKLKLGTSTPSPTIAFLHAIKSLSHPVAYPTTSSQRWTANLPQSLESVSESESVRSTSLGHLCSQLWYPARPLPHHAQSPQCQPRRIFLAAMLHHLRHQIQLRSRWLPLR